MTNNIEPNDNSTPRSGGSPFSIGRLAAWALVIGLLSVVAIQLRKAQLGSVQINQPAPAFTLTTFDDQEITPADMAGKVVVLNFWASWCLPCEQEAPELQAAWEMYAPRGDVLFLGAAYVDTDVNAAAYLERFAITYPSGHDFGTNISQAFRLRGVPETYVIDKSGNIRFIKIGPFLSLDEIIQAVDLALEP
jgi:cytochrome c biogenesis protein CcmG/thiol:disulfide interchange protein DsbE